MKQMLFVLLTLLMISCKPTPEETTKRFRAKIFLIDENNNTTTTSAAISLVEMKSYHQAGDTVYQDRWGKFKMYYILQEEMGSIRRYITGEILPPDSMQNGILLVLEGDSLTSALLKPYLNKKQVDSIFRLYTKPLSQ